MLLPTQARRPGSQAGPGEATAGAELGVGDRQWAMSWATWAQVAQPQAGVTGAGLATCSWILGPKFQAGH